MLDYQYNSFNGAIISKCRNLMYLQISLLSSINKKIL